MRQITKDAIAAFIKGVPFKRDNTAVRTDHNGVYLALHGNIIAMSSDEFDGWYISNAGWFTNTTKDRLNGLPGVSIVQKQGVWYLNGTVWDGSWTVLPTHKVTV